ncbi:HAMP domain-containing sensor histidine kinase [Kibdelosporangium persicum]|uniref:histidine kinase n=1 Tax=Kibdelosporangium persicum TaxID=2698649 RepID=A0ABX2FJS1_9PSEU|nr:ATP-binding protein [Kibdelosporangium persicum]NRN71041.1 Integral membrane sensor signal transduction histidine kinase [Kibdelosporangium persicum]
MTRRWRSTIRVRLTLLYAGAFVLAGVMLVIFMFIYFGHSLDAHAARRATITEQITADFLNAADAHDSQNVDQLHEALKGRFQQDRDDTLHAMLIWSLISLGVVGVAAGGLGWLLAGRALRPLQQITATARRVADRSLHERIGLDGPHDEIKDLADTFDAMLERLDRSFDGQRRFVANASHELRTPLTINRTLIQVALDTPNTPHATRQLGTTLLDVNQRHERLIDGLLVLATSDQPLTERSRVDLAEITQYVAAMSSDAAREARVQIRTTIASAPVVGDPVLLERLAQNLLDNAIRYNIAEHGWISITSRIESGHACLTVENTGTTVPGDEVDKLFEPFQRLGPADRLADRGRGAGLGLSIVRAVAHAHDGHVHAHPRPDGGLTIHVRIPAASSGQPDPEGP